jgi:hypothetical protein
MAAVPFRKNSGNDRFADFVITANCSTGATRQSLMKRLWQRIFADF